MLLPLLLVMVLIGACAPGAASAAPLPVPYDLAGLAASGMRPDAPPGANDFTCRPTPAHPRPVVLVHGLGGTAGSNWGTMSPLLANNGFCVFALTYGARDGLAYTAGFKRMQESAAELDDAFVERVLAATKTSQVDLLGHSEGTVMPRWWLRFMGGAAKVKRYVQFTPLWNGTQLGGSSFALAAGNALSGGMGDATVAPLFAENCASCPQLVSGSSYLNAVNAAPGPAEPTLEYTGIATRYDQLVIPYTSGLLDAPNVKNIVLQDVCAQDASDHVAVVSPNAAQLALNALAPAQAQPVRCVPVTPLSAVGRPVVGLGPEPAAAPAASSCAIRLRVAPRRGERIRRLTVVANGRRIKTRRGRALRSVVVRRATGRTTFRVRVTSARGARTVVLRRTVRC